MKETFIVVMPAYNEEGCIKSVVNSWISLIRKFPGSEMLIVNDGSTDKTKEILDRLKHKFKELKILHKKNESHGATILKCYQEAVQTSHNWVFQTDSDQQFNPEDFNKLWANRQDSNFILGYRFRRKDIWYRKVVTKMIILFIIVTFGKFIKDPNIPYRLIKKDYLKKLLVFLPTKIFAPNIFLSILAISNKQNLINVPVLHQARKTGIISIKEWGLIKSCFRGFKELFLFRLNFSSIMRKLNQKEEI